MDGREIIGCMEKIWMYPRSPTGKGTLDTLKFIKGIHPEMTIQSHASGSRVFDWEIPHEWNIQDAYIQHESGQRFAEFSKHPLHVLGYSIPCDRKLDKKKLLEHIHTQPDQPDFIPYVTSYYADRWGFCMSENEKNKLPEGRYRAVIRASKKPGVLNLGELILPGNTDEEIFFSTYVCHPAMANNELSGPLVATALATHIKEHHPGPRYTYRFVFVPETIRAIAYLSDHLSHLKRHVKAGFVLSCLGDERAYSHIESRLGNSLADTALAAALLGKKNKTTYSFLERGSDERQYCSPGVDLPVCTFCRSKYGEFPEYHTSADDLSFVTPRGLEGSLGVLKTLVDAFEIGPSPRATTPCEPQLGKRNLYPTISQKHSADHLRTRMDVLAYADGHHTPFDLALKLETPLVQINEELNLLIHHGLIQ